MPDKQHTQLYVYISGICWGCFWVHVAQILGSCVRKCRTIDPSFSIVFAHDVNDAVEGYCLQFGSTIIAEITEITCTLLFVSGSNYGEEEGKEGTNSVSAWITTTKKTKEEFLPTQQ